MPAWAQKARVRFTFVSASTKPMGVFRSAVSGVADWVQTWVPVPVHFTPNGAQSPPAHTEIGLIMTKPFTGVSPWASAPHTKNAVVENNVTRAIARQHSLKL